LVGRANFGRVYCGVGWPAIIPGSGHWLAEEAPDEFLAALIAFLTPYRDGTVVAAVR
jgi:hypothetical protein